MITTDIIMLATRAGKPLVKFSKFATPMKQKLEVCYASKNISLQMKARTVHVLVTVQKFTKSMQKEARNML